MSTETAIKPVRRRVSALRDIKTSLQRTMDVKLKAFKKVDIQFEDLKRMGDVAQHDALRELTHIVNLPDVTDITSINEKGEEVVTGKRNNITHKIHAANSIVNVNRYIMDRDERENGAVGDAGSIIFGEEDRISSDGTSVKTKTVTVTKKEQVTEQVIQDMEDAALDFVEDFEI